jgi:hypothetical protein
MVNTSGGYKGNPIRQYFSQSERRTLCEKREESHTKKESGGSRKKSSPKKQEGSTDAVF